MTDSRFRLPTLDESVHILSQQTCRAEQIRQCKFMAEIQSEEFARRVWAKANQDGKIKKK